MRRQSSRSCATQPQRLWASASCSPTPISRLSTPRRPSSPGPRATSAPIHSADTVAQLQIDPRLARLTSFDAAGVRGLLVQTLGQPNLILDAYSAGASAGAPAPLAEVTAAISLLMHPAAIIDSRANLVLEVTPDHLAAPEIPEQQPAKVAAPTPAPEPPPSPGVYLPYKPYVPPTAKASSSGTKTATAAATEPLPKDPLTAFYRQLAALHHGNAVIRYGSPTFLDFDAQNVVVWVVRGATVSPQTPPVIIACNLSGSAAQLPLGPTLKGLGLHGNYLRTLLRSDKTMGPQDLNSVVLPAHSVYVGELHR